jgi:hypothetical protein
MTSKAWKFSKHAIVRLAERIGLLVDMGVEAEISRTMNSHLAKILTANGKRVIYELPILGVPMIAVCNTDKRVVITFIDAKKWKRKMSNGRRKRANGFRPKSSGEEE